MTVAELIQRLQAFPPDMRVVTPGFDESNYDDIDLPAPVRIVFNDASEGGHCGRHKAADDDEDGVGAVCINF